ncbi:BPIB4 protein, partial [Eudromia elegans]|nr:BPIB4 protein [Eudromia elegans]
PRMRRLLGALLLCGLVTPSREALPGLSCAVSPRALQNVLAGAILQSGLLRQHLQSLLLSDIVGHGGMIGMHVSITGLRLLEVHVLDLSVILLPGFGVRMSIAMKLDLRGNCLMGLLSEVIDITAEVSVGMNIKCTNYESGTVQVIVEDCLCIFGDVKLNLLSGLLSLSLSDLVHAQLTGTLPALLCSVMNAMVNILNVQLLSMLNAVIQIGTGGTIQYQLANTPFTTDSFLGLDLEAVVQQAGGSIIPYDPSPLPLPPLHNKLLLVGVHESFFNAALRLLIHRQVQTFACTPEAVSTEHRASVAAPCLRPPQCPGCSRTSPLSVRIALSGSPRCALEANKATLRLAGSVQLLSQRPDGSLLSLLLLRAVSASGEPGAAARRGPRLIRALCSQDLALRVRLSVSGGRLMLAVTLG